MFVASRLLTFLSILAVASAAKVGYLDSEKCIDPAGMESCGKKSEETCDECSRKTNITPKGGCYFAYTQDLVTCVATHCWDQAYSCEYQQTVQALINPWDKDTLEGIPFYPPPENAAAACDCKYSDITRSSAQIESSVMQCGPSSGDQAKQEISDACKCCRISGKLSPYPQVCPNHNLTSTTFGTLMQAALEFDDGFWLSCGAIMDKFPCESQPMNFTIPPEFSEPKFYKPEDFSTLGGTKTLANSPGTITAPISGATFTWTHLGREMTVTAANWDAKPTGDSDREKTTDEDSGKGNKEGSASRQVSSLSGILVLTMAWIAFV